MSSPSKRKGTRWESDVAGYLGARRIGSIFGANDQGDIEDPQWVIECKDEARISLSTYMDELEREMANARAKRAKAWGIAIVKRRRRATADGYAVMPLWMFKALRDHLRRLQAIALGGMR